MGKILQTIVEAYYLRCDGCDLDSGGLFIEQKDLIDFVRNNEWTCTPKPTIDPIGCDTQWLCPDCFNDKEVSKDGLLLSKDEWEKIHLSNDIAVPSELAQRLQVEFSFATKEAVELHLMNGRTLRGIEDGCLIEVSREILDSTDDFETYAKSMPIPNSTILATAPGNLFIGSTLNSFLEEEGIKDQVDELTLKKLATCEVCDKMFGVHFADIDVCWGHEVPVKGVEI